MKKNQIKAGVFLSYIILLVSTGVSLIYTPFLLKHLGKSEYGLYSLVYSIVGYITILDFGFGNAIIRYTAKYHAEGKFKKERLVHGMFFVIYLFISVITLLIGVVIVVSLKWFFHKTMTAAQISETQIMLLLAVLNLAFSFSLGIFGSIMTAYEKFIFPRIINLITTLISPAVMIALLLFGHRAVSLIVVNTILNLFSLVMNVFYCRYKLRIKIEFHGFQIGLLKEIIAYSFYIFLNAIVDKLYWSSDQFILGAVSGSVAISVYAIGAQFNTYFISLSTAISGVFLPRVTAISVQDSNNKQLSDLFIKVGRIQFIVLAFALGGFILYGQEFIKLWAGSGFTQSYYIALILIIPISIPLIQNIGISILQAKNMQKFRSVVYILVAIGNVVLSVFLAKKYQGIGSAIGTSAAMIIGNIIIINIYYYKRVHLEVPRFFAQIIAMIPAAAVPCVLGFVLKKYYLPVGPLKLLISCVLYSAVYIFSMTLIGMNKYERTLFYAPLKRLFMKSKSSDMEGV